MRMSMGLAAHRLGAFLGIIILAISAPVSLSATGPGFTMSEGSEEESGGYGAGSFEPPPSTPTATPVYGGGSDTAPPAQTGPAYYDLFNRDPGKLHTSSMGLPPAVAINSLDKDLLAIDNFDSYAPLNHLRIRMGKGNDTMIGQYLCRTRLGVMTDAGNGTVRGSANFSMCWKRNGNSAIGDFTSTLIFRPKGSHRVTLQTNESGQVRLSGTATGSAAGLATLNAGACVFEPGSCTHRGKTIIDIQVLYTPEAINADLNGDLALSEAAVLSEIVNEVTDANQAFCNSGVPAWLRLVYAGPTDSQTYGVDTPLLLSDFKAQAEGRNKFEGVHALRMTSGADLSFLYVANSSYTINSCGLTSAPSSADGISQYTNAFAVMNRRCRGQYTLAELTGHLMGLDHSWDTTSTPPAAEASQATGDSRIAPFARGYRSYDSRPDGFGNYGTLMTSAGGVTVLPVFSTNNSTVRAACGGVPLGIADVADSVRALSQGNVTIQGRSGSFTGSVSATAAFNAAKYRDYYYVDQNCQGIDCVDTEGELYGCFQNATVCSYKTFKNLVDAVSASIFVPGRFLDSGMERWNETPDRLHPSRFHAPTDIHYLQDRPADIGDLILVAPGVYHERIGIRESNVTLRSIAGPTLTTIDARPDPMNGNRPSRRVSFGGLPVVQIWGQRSDLMTTPSNVSDAAAVYHPTIQGFTLTGGHGIMAAGGVSCLGQAAPKILGNIIIDNSSHSGSGGGISFRGCGGEISGNVIARNRIDGVCRALDNKPGTISDTRNLRDWCNVFVGRDGDPSTLEAWTQIDANGDGVFDASEQTHVPVDNDRTPNEFVDWGMSIVGKEFAPVIGISPYTGTSAQAARLFKPAQHITGGAGIYVSNVCQFRDKADWRESVESICADASVSGELLISNNLIYDNVIDRNASQPYFDYTNVYQGSGSRGVVYAGVIKTNGVVDLANNSVAGAGILIDGLANRDLLASGDGFVGADDSVPTTPGVNNLKIKVVNNTITNNRYKGAASGVSGAGIACRGLSGMQLRVMNTVVSGNYAGNVTGTIQNLNCPGYLTSSNASIVVGDGINVSTSPAGLFLIDPTTEPRPPHFVPALDPYNYSSEEFGLAPGVSLSCTNGIRTSSAIDKALCAPVVDGDTIIAPDRDIRGLASSDIILVGEGPGSDCDNNGLAPKDIGAIERQAAAPGCGSSGGVDAPPRDGG